MKKFYVAYGSNLNLAQMAARCPNASVFATGLLNDWELVYRGSMRNSHATIRKCTGCFVPVLVWEITKEDERRLDKYEGYPIYYQKKTVDVEIHGGKVRAMVYIMDKRHAPGRPSKYYIDTIHQGYIDNDLDLEMFNRSLELNYMECS